MKTKTILCTVLALVLALTVLAGCSGQTATNSNLALSDTGCITLSVNPEISVHYDKEGRVTKLEGVNDDGKSVVGNVKDYIGKDTKVVIRDLVTEINRAGYLDPDANGNVHNITIHMESGSVMPDENFLDSIASDVRQTVGDMNISARVGVRNGDSNYGSTDYGDSNYNDSAYGSTNNNDSAYGSTNYNDSAYDNTNNNDSAYSNTNYNDSAYGSTNNNDSAYGSTNNNDSAYGSTNNNDSAYGNSNYSPASTSQPTNPPAPPPPPVSNDSGYSDSNYGNSGYSGGSNDSGYGSSGNSNSGYGDSGYDD